jgi:hypothetical protein
MKNRFQEEQKFKKEVDGYLFSPLCNLLPPAIKVRMGRERGELARAPLATTHTPLVLRMCKDV